MSTEHTLPLPPSQRPEDMPPSDPWGQPAALADDDPPPVTAPPVHTPPSGYPPPQASGSPISASPYSASPYSAQPFSAQPFSGQPFSGQPVPATPDYPRPSSGGPAALPADPGQVIAQVGEITVTATQIRTPAGVIPLAGSSWQVTEHWQTERETPGWAILAAVLGFLVLTVFSLLFLLVKRPVRQGTAQVTVSHGPHHYVARVPVADQGQLQNLHNQVSYLQSLAAVGY